MGFIIAPPLHADARFLAHPERDPNRDLAANELLLLVNKMDQTFKVARPELADLLATSLTGSSRREEALNENISPSTPDPVKPPEPPKTEQ